MELKQYAGDQPGKNFFAQEAYNYLVMFGQEFCDKKVVYTPFFPETVFEAPLNMNTSPERLYEHFLNVLDHNLFELDYNQQAEIFLRGRAVLSHKIPGYAQEAYFPLLSNCILGQECGLVIGSQNQTRGTLGAAYCDILLFLDTAIVRERKTAPVGRSLRGMHIWVGSKKNVEFYLDDELKEKLLSKAGVLQACDRCAALAVPQAITVYEEQKFCPNCSRNLPVCIAGCGKIVTEKKGHKIFFQGEVNKRCCNACYPKFLKKVYLKQQDSPRRSAIAYHPANKAGRIYKSTRMIGVELECEWGEQELSGSKQREIALAVPACVGIGTDGSLSNGLEMRTPPAAGAALEEIITKSCAGLKSVGGAVSTRCGTHVHFNAQDFGRNREMWARLFYTYFYFEDVIASWHKNARVTNRYCKTFKQNRIDESFIEETLRNPEARDPSGFADRYSALNMTSIVRHGTMEIRALAGTLDPERILHFALFHARIMRYAKNHFKRDEILSMRDKTFGERCEFFAKMIKLPSETKNYWFGESMNQHPKDLFSFNRS